MEFLQLEPVDQPHGAHLAVTREAYLVSVHGERVAFDGHYAVSGGSQGQDELAVARTDDRDSGVRSNTSPQGREELREEGEGVLPQALCLHGRALLAYRWR
ncbi:hypothetical protein GCM10020295_44660 [Streptomyces cinereospinus]